MPANDLPPVLRRGVPNMRFEPVLQLVSRDKTRIVRIGERVLSYHVARSYPGWDQFERELGAAVKWVCKSADGLQVRSLGLRYVNALTSADHFIESVKSLALEIRVANEDAPNDFSLALGAQPTAEHRVVSRIASPSFSPAIFRRRRARLLTLTSRRSIRSRPTTLMA